MFTLELFVPAHDTKHVGKSRLEKTVVTCIEPKKKSVESATSLVPDETVRIPNSCGNDAYRNLAAASHSSTIEKKVAPPTVLEKAIEEAWNHPEE